jgi:DNA gyrase subunit A
VQAIQHFIDHRIDVVRRRTVYLLQKAREREHILVGYKIALDNLDEVIKLIRGSANRAEAKEKLIAAKLKVTDRAWVKTLTESGTMARSGTLDARQADAILDLQLHRLTRLSQDEILKELEEIRIKIAEYEAILASDKKLRAVIIKELEEVREQYGDERRTEITDESTEITLEDLIADEPMVVTMSHSGYLKRTPITTYRQQRRGGTGRMGMKTRDEDFVEYLFIASTHSYLLILTNTGRVYWLKVYEIPDVGAAGKGKHVGNLVALQPGETVRTLLEVRNLDDENNFVFFVTRKGVVKKTPVKDFSNVMSRGIIAIGIEKDDELVAARLTDGQQIIFLASHEGQAIRFAEEDVRPMGRPAYGVRGMDLDKGDYIVGMAVTPKEQRKKTGKPKDGKDGVEESVPSLILSVTENGYGKRTPVEEYRLQSRGGKGVINVKTTERNGRVVAIMLVDEDSEAMLISHFGKIIRTDTKQIREAGRSTQGVRLLHLEAGDKVASAAVIQEKEVDPNGNLLQ